MNAALPEAWARGPSAGLLEEARARGVLICSSRDPDAKLTFLVTDAGPGQQRLAVKIPSTDAAGAAVDAETRTLLELARLDLGALSSTIPAHVASLDLDGRPVLVSTAVTGTPMSIAYHRWPHTARKPSVSADFSAAFAWLQAFQHVTAHGPVPVDWPGQVLDGVLGRWDGHPALTAAVRRLRAAAADLADLALPCTAVHGDFWLGNVMVERRTVTGVVDWEAGSTQGSPLPDAVRFVLSYSLYLDRHTRPGRAVLGHRGLHRTGFGPGVEHALCGSGWYPDLVRATMARHLERLGADPALWYAATLTGLGEIAASANSDDFGAGHLELLARLPSRLAARGR